MQAAHIPTPPPAALRVEYRHEPLASLLADGTLLAVLGFGVDAPRADPDPRYLHVALPTPSPTPFECWFAGGPVKHGRDDDIAWATDGTLLFGAMAIADTGDIESVAAAGYQRLYASLARSGPAHPLRVWNYMDAITAGDGDAERYRRFCVGRARGIRAALGRDLEPAELPAATAIGHPRATGRFQLYWLASREPGTPIDNPRQTQAWRYPRQYGPQAPGFSRAMLPPPGTRMPLLVSGTAAVVGHVSQHSDSLERQLDETLSNLDHLIGEARMWRPELPATTGKQARLKIYVRDAHALAPMVALLEARLPREVPRIILHGDICRAELAVEIDGVHA